MELRFSMTPGTVDVTPCRTSSPSPPRTDGQFVAACLAGEPGAVEALFNQYHQRLVDHLRRHLTLGRHHDAEDIAQEALIKALGALDQFDQTAPLWPWLRRIAENTTKDHYRLARHRREVADDGVDHDQHLPSGEDHSERTALRDHLLRALKHMSPEHREVVIEVDLKGAAQRETATMFGISDDALRKRLERARESLRSSYMRVASLAFPQWLTKLVGSKLAASGALTSGLAAVIPALIIAGMALGPMTTPLQRPVHIGAPSTASSAALPSDPWVETEVTRPDSLAPPTVVPIPSATADPRDAAPSASERTAGLASEVRAPEVVAPVVGVRNTNEFDDGDGFTTYSVPATDLDGSGPLKASNDDEEADPVHAAACHGATTTGVIDCQRGGDDGGAPPRR